MFKSKESLRLLIFMALVLTVPAVVSHVLPAKGHFDAKPIARLRAKKPNIVILSDSMVDNGVDPELLGKLLSGRRVELLWYGGTASAVWYFRLKNYIVASDVHPELVCILFRDCVLTNPSFRTGGIYRSKLEAAMHPDEPTYQLVLGKGFAGEGDMQRWLDKIYSLDARRYALHEKIEQSSLRLVATAGPAVTKLRRWINHTFALTNLSGAGAEEAAAVTKARQTKFDPDPRRSFLPHMVATAAEARLPLCFVRVKRHPSADGTVEQSESLRKYTSDLRKWIEDHGCFFADDTENAARTPDMFVQPVSDHTAASARERSTELYADKLRPFLSP
jgi:hypothetical protein